MAERSPSVHWLVLAFILVSIVGSAAVLGIVPLSRCPQDEHQGPGRTCSRCGERGRITLLDRWKNGNLSLNDWEGKTLASITTHGCVKRNPQPLIESAGIRPGAPLRSWKFDRALNTLFATDWYVSVSLSVTPDARAPGKVVLHVVVIER